MKNTELIEVDAKTPAVVIEQDPMLAMIDRVCLDPNFDIAKMEKMIDMRNAELQRLAKIEFNKDFAEVQPKLPRVVSTHKNQQTNSNYAKIEDINETILPIISEFGFGVRFAVLAQDNEGVTIRANLTHRSGHVEHTDLQMPYDKVGIKGTVNKTNIHATGSAVKYASRYALCMLFNISTGDDNDGVRYIAEETAQKIKTILQSSKNIDTKAFLNFMKASCVDKILSKDFEKANIALDRKLKEKRELFKKDDNETN